MNNYRTANTALATRLGITVRVRKRGTFTRQLLADIARDARVEHAIDARN